MSLKLMYITNKERIATMAEDAGVDWIFIDLELNGKEERQVNLNSVISRHKIEDVSKVRKVIKTSKLLVRINSIYDGSKDEIDKVVTDGADIIMLPYYKTIDEVKKFLSYVNGRSETCLLLETPEAVDILDDTLAIDGIDYIHIGLNDLHLGYKKKFMFELLADGTVEAICKKISKKGITYGFGGIARIGHGMLPAEYVISEHYRLGSQMAILSRSFCDLNKLEDENQAEFIFKEGLQEIRNFEKSLLSKDDEYFNNNKEILKEKVNKIVQKM